MKKKNLLRKGNRHYLFQRIFGMFTFWIAMVLSVVVVNAQSYEWDNVAIGGGGFVSGVFFSPIEQNVIYTRTDVGGAYRWNESSKSWTSLMDWVNSDERGLLGVEALAIDPSQAGTVYLMAGTVYWNQADDGIGRSAFLRSHDYGQTWEKIPVWDNSTKYFNVHGNGMGRGNGERLAVDPANSNTMFYGTRNKGLWKSTNNGDSWSKVNSFPVDTTWNGCGVSFVAFDPSTSSGSQTSRIYVGVLRKSDNVFVSEDGGSTWSLVPNRPVPQYATDLMPQRIAIRPDGSELYITFGNGAGPHTMQWDEGWGPINDWFNRGAVFKYTVSTQTWANISPQNLIDADDGASDPSTYYGCYSGISIDPNNPDHMVASSIASYRGPQFWLIDGTWQDKWGDNIFVTEDGGDTWVPSFEYYWLDGGITPNTEQMDENGIPWIIGGTIHWIGSTAIDPFNPQRVFVTSGNGVFMTENIFNYEWSYVNDWGAADTTYDQYTVWKFAAQGIEEVVPEDLVSIPDGPLVSVIGDYDGFVHDDITQYPALGQHKTSAAGSIFTLGSTTGLAYAPQSGKLAKVAKTRSVSTQYNTIPIGPVQYSTDNGATWTVETYTSNPPTDLNGGKVALSSDGAVTLWMPSTGTTMYRQQNSSWTTVSGISFNGRPVGDWENENMFYVYNNADGYMYVSTNAGASFSQAGYAGASNFKTARAVPYNEGHIWVPIANYDGTGGLMRSSDGGTTFSAVPGVGYCEAVGFGKAATGATYPTIFVFAEIDGVRGIWRSTDEGVSWVHINDDEHEYGGLANGEFVIGDMNVFGRVYMSTAGRGIVYGESSGSGSNTLSVSTNSLTFTEAEGSQTVAVTSNVSWAVTDNQSWITVTPASGSNNGTLTITVSANTTSSNRTGTVTVTGGGITSTISIMQTGIVADQLSITPTSISFSSDANDQIVTVTSNVSWTVTSDQSWISLSPASGSNNGNFTVTATANTASTSRSGTVTISGGSITQTISVTQTGTTAEEILTVSPTNISFSASAENQIINVSSNLSWTVTSDLSWITLSPASSSSDGSFTVLATENTSTSSRSGSITVSGGTITVYIAVTQAAGNGGTETCENPTAISLPFTQNGTGTYCWVTSGNIDYVNSWALDVLEINGVDYTNRWSNSMPERINGNYYIYYSGVYGWSHFEASGSNSARMSGTDISDLSNPEELIAIYPNPSGNGKFSVDLPSIAENMVISIHDLRGKMIYSQSAGTAQHIEIEADLTKGIYLMTINSININTTRKIIVE